MLNWRGWGGAGQVPICSNSPGSHCLSIVWQISVNQTFPIFPMGGQENRFYNQTLPKFQPWLCFSSFKSGWVMKLLNGWGRWYDLPCQLVEKALGWSQPQIKCLVIICSVEGSPLVCPGQMLESKSNNCGKNVIGMFANNISFSHRYLSLHQQEL